VAVETGWMAAAETRVPDATKALAEREASMDGTTCYLSGCETSLARSMTSIALGRTHGSDGGR
jgi:hypothetical protein